MIIRVFGWAGAMEKSPLTEQANYHSLVRRLPHKHMFNKPAQKRIYFEGAQYFITLHTKDWVTFFNEPIFCEVFVAVLKLSKAINKYNLFAFVVLIHHAHLLFAPDEATDMSKIMQFIKRNCARNINFILGHESEESLLRSLNKLSRGSDPWKMKLRTLFKLNKLNEKYHNPPNKYTLYKELIGEHCEFLIQLRKKFENKYGANQSIFAKFKWEKSFRDHYIRNEKDFDNHLKYIFNNTFKHKVPDPENYQYIYTKYPEIIDLD